MTPLCINVRATNNFAEWTRPCWNSAYDAMCDGFLMQGPDAAHSAQFMIPNFN